MVIVNICLNVDNTIKSNLLISKWMDRILGIPLFSYPKNCKGP